MPQRPSGRRRAPPGIIDAALRRRLQCPGYLFSAGHAAVASVIVAGRATLVTAGRHRARDTITARYKTTLAGLF